MIHVLAIETSCDETGVALMAQDGEVVRVVSSRLASQVDVHTLTGGVVPRVAAREHEKVLKPLVSDVLSEAKLSPENLAAVAVTVGPGLAPALRVGVSTARELATKWGKKIIPINHLEGHIYSALASSNNRAEFPVLALIVSGGHTQLILLRDILQYEIIGSTRDDAAGEAFDKVARMLQLPYPGGPALSQLAQQGNPTAFAFTRPMVHSSDFDFSFSGLKTNVLYTLRDIQKRGQEIPLADIAASFEAAVVEVLVKKTVAAAREYGVASVVLAGGVAANEALRHLLAQALTKNNISFHVAPRELCGDNAIMIGQAALLAYAAGRLVDPATVDFNPRPNLQDFSQALESKA